MLITRARPEHLDKINILMSKYNIRPMTQDFINNFDICVIAIDGPDIVGCLWCGVMANRSIGYIDYYTIDPEYAGKNVAIPIGQKFVSVCRKKGIKKLIGFIEHAQFHEKSLGGSRKIGMYPDTSSYTAVFGGIEQMAKHLGV